MVLKPNLQPHIKNETATALYFRYEVLGAVTTLQITAESEEQGDILCTPSIICIHIQGVVILTTYIHLSYGLCL